MRLHDFIRDHREEILAEWETFARTVSTVSGTMDVAALRDHADEMLTVIAADLMTAQSSHEQAEKSKGRAEETEIVATAAEEHGAARAESGFAIGEMVAEYRALRASVLSLWTREVGELKTEDVEDLMRFNEAIDQSLAESVTEFTEDVEEAKEMFLAILGHDLRTPLGAIYTSAKFLLETGELKEPQLSLLSRIVNSANRTVDMVGDLLDFTRSRLGGGIPVVREKLNLGKLLHEAVDEIAAAHPDRNFQVDTRDEQSGEWDAARLSQALTNLIGNAGEHAPAGTRVSVGLDGDADAVAITIHNMGAVIPGDRLDGLFNPLKTRKGGSVATSGGPMGNLGLGLYIAERIVHAHGGRIDVESAEKEGTTFTVHLPRRE
ncbi:MAG TPA: sensor histidine kinase, partial [Longimicrobiales bacterium]|nr:sensor histidine kinase [Longimicrobiales bacterium]